MKARAAATLAAAVLLAALSAAVAQQPATVILPLFPEDQTHPREGASLSSKLLWQLNERAGNAEAVGLDWSELSRLMELSGLDRRRAAQNETLRAIGKALGAKRVVTGSFRARGETLVARLRIVDVASGRESAGRPWASERDIVVEPPSLTVAPPVLEGDDLDLRDAVADSPCVGAGDRIDALERDILDLKARYWALQLSKGVHMAGIKFNPGSTITDPDLKKEFYSRMKRWQAEAYIPDLTPMELKQFAEADEQAFKLARLCGIL